MTKTKIAISALAFLAVLAAGVVAFLPTPVEAGASSAAEAPLFLEPNVTLPNCFDYDGLPCVIGTKFRCMNAPYEPGVCRCPAGTYVCG